MKTFRTDPDRFGIRARLLTLLLPGILCLLALDSWNDYRALTHLVQDAYDRAMLDSVNALRGSLTIAPDGSLRLGPRLASPPADADSASHHKYVHVGLAPRAEGQGASAKPPVAMTLLGAPDLPAPPVAGVTAQAPGAVWYDADYRGKPLRLVAYRGEVLDGHGKRFELLVQVAQSTFPRAEAESLPLQQQLLRDARMVLVVILLVWLGVTWSLRPLERLRRSVLENKGRDLTPLDTSGVPHEVAPLVEAVNQQVASHRALLDQQAQFLADASHQLRTPLAIMLTQAGVALREKSPEQLHETLRAMVVQISRSRRLCEQLLSLAHASEHDSPVETPGIVDLQTIAKDVVLQYLALAHEKSLDLGWKGMPEDVTSTPHTAESELPPGDAPAAAVPVRASGPELHEVLSNLVHNAIAYTPPGGHVTVSVMARDGQALVEVHDDGPGIAVERRAAVFQRFHHEGSTPGKGPHGAGLGLAIARAYARRNGGDIELSGIAVGDPGQDRSATGLRAVLRLPLN
ncbi:MAG: sensor histidine kinase [Burkholderiales bacterium]|nr:MAG: sensor histidine kinase [Burkholderiales bacterium]